MMGDGQSFRQTKSLDPGTEGMSRVDFLLFSGGNSGRFTMLSRLMLPRCHLGTTSSQSCNGSRAVRKFAR